MKKILVVFSILLIGAALFLLLKNTAEKSTVENATPDVSVDASALFAEFSSDESAANEKYLNKVVVVSGTVAKTVGSENGAMPTLRLESGREEGAVLCIFDRQLEHQRKEFHTGENVTLQCLCMDYYRDVKLVGCFLTQ